MRDPFIMLAKVCSLFGSDQIGERAAAAAQAENIRRKIGKEWSELFTGQHQGRDRQRQPVFDPLTAPPAALAGAFEDFLSEWDFEFLKSISRRNILTSKQSAVFHRIRIRCAEWSAGVEARTNDA